MDTLSLDIGGLTILLRSRNLPVRQLEEIYGTFEVRNAHQYDLLADVERISPDRPVVKGGETDALRPIIQDYFQRTVSAVPDRNQVVRAQVEVTSAYLSSPGLADCLRAYHPTTGRWTLFGISQSGAWFMNDKTTEAHVFLVDNEDEKLARVLDLYVYVLLRASLAKRRGVLLHASSVVDDGRSYLFIGPSGSGKTTIARAAHALGWPILADDGSIIRQMADGRFWAFRTPWNMLPSPWNGSFGKRPDCAIIGALFFIEQDGVDRWKRLRPTASAARLVQSAFLSLKQMEGESSPRLFEWLTQLGSHIPCYALHFTASCGFLRDIEHAAQKGRERT